MQTRVYGTEPMAQGNLLIFKPRNPGLAETPTFCAFPPLLE